MSLPSPERSRRAPQIVEPTYEPTPYQRRFGLNEEIASSNQSQSVHDTQVTQEGQQVAEVQQSEHKPKQILNSPSTIWGALLNERKKEKNRIQLESLQWTCCEVRTAVRRRDNVIVSRDITKCMPNIIL